MILPVPHLQQPRDGDCLPACAYMVLAYMGKRVRFWRLRWLLNTKSFGTPFSQIRRLERFGFTIDTDRHGNRALLQAYLSRNHPCIVSIETENLPYWEHNVSHAVVVVGMDQGTLYLNDPALEDAPIAVDYADFDLAWLAHDERYAVIR